MAASSSKPYSPTNGDAPLSLNVMMRSKHDQNMGRMVSIAFDALMDLRLSADASPIKQPPVRMARIQSKIMGRVARGETGAVSIISGSDAGAPPATV